jgi:hypothetical protein
VSQSVSLKSVIARIFGTGDDEIASYDWEGGEVPETLSAPQKPQAAVRSPADVVEGLKRCIASTGEARVGRIQLIGLSKFREAFGADWARMEEKAKAVAAAAIERRLAKGDIYTQYGEEDYIILFASLTECEAQVKSALIAREISNRLIGACADSSLVEVKTAVAVVGPELKFEDVDPDPLLKDVLRRAAAPVDPPLEPPAAASTETDQPSGDPLARLSLAFVYRPIWFVKRKIISSYVCVPARAERSGNIAYGYSVLPGGDKSGLVGDLDCATLQRIAGDLDKRAGHESTPILCTAVHFETLARTATRTRFFEICGTIPAPLRQRIIFELVGVPTDIAPSRLYQISTLLRAACRAVLLRVPLDFRDFARVRGQPFHALCADLSGDSQSEAEKIREMEQFAERVRRRGFRTYTHGLRSVGLTVAAVYAGFDYIDGDTVTSLNEGPAQIHTFELEDVFRSLIAEGPSV